MNPCTYHLKGKGKRKRKGKHTKTKARNTNPQVKKANKRKRKTHQDLLLKEEAVGNVTHTNAHLSNTPYINWRTMQQEHQKETNSPDSPQARSASISYT